MLIVNLTPESNGAHASQSINVDIAPPDGWIAIPKELEATAQSCLPFIKMILTDGIVTAVEDDIEARLAWESQPLPIPEPADKERLEALEAAMLELVLGGTA